MFDLDFFDQDTLSWFRYGMYLIKYGLVIQVWCEKYGKYCWIDSSVGCEYCGYVNVDSICDDSVM